MSTIGHEHETIRVEQMKTTLQAYLDRFGGGSGYTKSEADAKFLTITAFENLFNAIGSDGTTKISHPYASGVASIKAMVGVWTNQYLSALGQNSGGGGGGGATLLEPLLSINESGLAAPGASQDGMTVVWDNTQQKWKYGSAGGGGGSTAWADITGKPTTIAGYGITDAKIVNGVITLGSNTITPLTSVTFNDLTSHPTTIAGYGITDAKFGTAGADYVPITLGSTTKNVLTAHQSLSAYATQTWVTNNFLGINATAAAAAKLTTVSKTAWGKTYWTANGVPDNVEGNIYAGSNGGIISGFHCIELNSEGSLADYGGFIDFHFNGSSSDHTSRIIEDASGRLHLNAPNGVRIGDAVLKWDSTNNALKVIKSDGTAGNIYATGGVSALGMSAGVSAMDAMTFGYLKVNDQLVFGNNQALIYKDDFLYIECRDDISVNNVEFDYSGNVYTNGNVRAERFYLDSNRYLYVSSGTLYYYNGTTSKQVAFTN